MKVAVVYPTISLNPGSPSQGERMGALQMNLQMVSWLVQQHGSPGAVAYIVIG